MSTNTKRYNNKMIYSSAVFIPVSASTIPIFGTKDEGGMTCSWGNDLLLYCTTTKNITVRYTVIPSWGSLTLCSVCVLMVITNQEGLYLCSNIHRCKYCLLNITVRYTVIPS